LIEAAIFRILASGMMGSYQVGKLSNFNKDNNMMTTWLYKSLAEIAIGRILQNCS